MAGRIIATIPDCTATHVLGDTSVELGRGTLMLVQPTVSEVPDQTPLSSSPSIQTLTLTIGPHTAFPLYPSTTFGTISSDPRAYLFTPSLETGPGTSVGGGQGGYVRIVLPEGVLDEGSELADAQEKLEKELIDFGVLKEGEYSVAEIGEDIGKSVRGGAESVGKSVRALADDHISSTDPVTHFPNTTFSPTTHSFIDTVTSQSQSTADWTSSARQAATNAAESAGTYVGQKSVDLSVAEFPEGNALDPGDVQGTQDAFEEASWEPAPTTQFERDQDSTVAAIKDYGTGLSHITSSLAAGSATLSSDISSATHDLIQHEFGDEVAGAGQDAVKVTNNVGRTMGNLVGVGGVGEVYGAAKGVVKGVQGETERLEEVELGK